MTIPDVTIPEREVDVTIPEREVVVTAAAIVTAAVAEEGVVPEKEREVVPETEEAREVVRRREEEVVRTNREKNPVGMRSQVRDEVYRPSLHRRLRRDGHL